MTPSTPALHHPFSPTLPHLTPPMASPIVLQPPPTRAMRRYCSSSSCFLLTARVRGSVKVASPRVSASAHEAVWEEPDDGSGSEYDEEEDGEVGGGWSSGSELEGGGGEVVASVDRLERVDAAYDEFVAGVELILEPQEKAILQQNVSPDLSKLSTNKWAALHTLALSGQIPFIDKLLDNGVDINSVDIEGYTPLHVAVIGKKEAVISHLLRKGANPHVRDKNGVTLLHYAVQVGALQTVKLLIKYKVDVNVADDEGWTPLHVAVQSRSREITKVLLVNGADKNRRNKDGKTPLDLSLCFGKEFKSYELAKLVKLVPENREL